MTARIRSILAPCKPYESLWSNAPPCFLAPALRKPFSCSVPVAATIKATKARKQVHLDAYALRQIQQRKQANLSRQAVLKEQAQRDLGDPIRGVETAFVRSFDSDVSQNTSKDIDTDAVDRDAVRTSPDQPPSAPAGSPDDGYLSHGLNTTELQRSLHLSRMLTEPLVSSERKDVDPDREAAERQRWEGRDQNATEAIQRIISLANGSGVDRTKRNIERVVSTLGRHKTDDVLKPRAALGTANLTAVEPTPRVGPDTGSSEVQIGVLTAKIRVLADRYEGKERLDKVNKRNLRLLLHRRQKLLKYMERKERGSERWSNMLSTLGLTPATWKGEIVLL